MILFATRVFFFFVWFFKSNMQVCVCVLYSDDSKHFIQINHRRQYESNQTITLKTNFTVELCNMPMKFVYPHINNT